MSKHSIYQILQVLQANKSYSQNWNITWSQGVLLSSIVSAIMPKYILEVGTSNGFSTLWMAYGSPSCSIVTVDINSSVLNQAIKNFQNANCSNQILPVASSIYSLDKNNFLEKFDFIFIDALQQEYEDVVSFLIKQDILKNNHTFVFDNVLSHNKSSSLKVFLEHLGYEVMLYNEGSGFLLATNNFS